MKKTLLSLLALASFSAAKAQADFTFEQTWAPAVFGSANDPVGWFSANVISNNFLFPPPGNNPQSVFEETASVHGGTSAAKITTVKLQNNPLAGSINDTVGILSLGAANTSGMKFGQPYTSRPANLEFWYKYAPTGSDNAGVTTYLTKWNTGTNQRDTVAAAFDVLSNASAYTLFSTAYVYFPAYLTGGNPDSIQINFSSSIGSFIGTPAPQIGSALWVDDIAFTGTNVGVKENSVKSTEVKLFPNPATTAINMLVSNEEATNVEIFDITGKKVSSTTLENKKAKISTESMSNGMYFYSIVDKDKKVLSTGKVNVCN